MQIEGVLHDYRLDLSNCKTAKRTLDSTVDEIDKQHHWFPDYAYYRFFFPQVRNKVAHGGHIKENESLNLAMMLLLDLYDVCRKITSDDLLINRVVRAVSDFDINNPDPGLQFKIVLSSNVPIPAFYELEGKRNQIYTTLSSARFWTVAEELVDKKSLKDSHMAGIRETLITIKKKGIEIEKCKELLSRIDYAQQAPASVAEIWDFFDRY